MLIAPIEESYGWCVCAGVLELYKSSAGGAGGVRSLMAQQHGNILRVVRSEAVGWTPMLIAPIEESYDWCVCAEVLELKCCGCWWWALPNGTAARQHFACI